MTQISCQYPASMCVFDGFSGKKKRRMVKSRGSPFSGNDVDLMTGSKIPFCTNSSLLARTEIFLSSAAIARKQLVNILTLSINLRSA